MAWRKQFNSARKNHFSLRHYSRAYWCNNNHTSAFSDEELKFSAVMEEAMERKTGYRTNCY